ncbi:MFS general substrate transporter [Pholiota conissans]|uniref:MFS general substrate transporter n=1 Tax=Pholiota conissans TaxID=109636 RepID=A0A9P5ZAR5_9AGAR|nr:MFS general substrate transporter [Pholiota conissans]
MTTIVSTSDTILVKNLYDDGSLDPVYYAKTLALNRAIQQIGMGRYQYLLFVVAGFGWFADSVWPLIGGLILTPVTDEFHFNPPFLSVALNAGLLVGAVFWGVGCDIWGRRWCFNVTLLVAGLFGLAAGGSNSFITLSALLAVMGIGVGGNLPIDSAVFLDFTPASHQYLLTFMSIFWCLGQLLVNLLAWPLIANFSCSVGSEECQRSQNMGWRYLLFLLGGITLILWIARFFLFKLMESPRYLIGKGEDEKAVAIINELAAYNGTTSSLTLDQLTSLGSIGSEHAYEGRKLSLSRTSNYTIDHIKALFRTRRMAYSTSLLISIWGVIGLASTLYNNFLPFLLASRGAHFGDSSLNITYRNTFILSVVGVPSAFLATYAVEIPFLGRRGALAASAALTGVFLFLTTIARTSNALLGWNCGYSFFSNIMYGILYAISPEIFPAKDRGTGNALTAAASRVFGLLAPIIALYANLSTAVPVYIAGALIMLGGGLALLIPYEPRGKASM